MAGIIEKERGSPERNPGFKIKYLRRSRRSQTQKIKRNRRRSIIDYKSTIRAGPVESVG